MDRLVTTRTYWALASSGGVTAIALLNIELEARIAALEAEDAALRAELDVWARVGWTTAAVLDTNSVMMHHASMRTMPWHELVGERDMRTVRVIIPLLVVDELDRLKRSTGDMTIGKEKYPRRTLARQALRTIAQMFPDANSVVSLNQSETAPYSRPVTVELLLDSPDHVRLDNPDAEIRDRALSLTSRVNRVVLLTYDLGNELAAGISGLEAIRLTDDEDRTLRADFEFPNPSTVGATSEQAG